MSDGSFDNLHWIDVDFVSISSTSYQLRCQLWAVKTICMSQTGQREWVGQRDRLMELCRGQSWVSTHTISRWGPLGQAQYSGKLQKTAPVHGYLTGEWGSATPATCRPWIMAKAFSFVAVVVVVTDGVMRSLYLLSYLWKKPHCVGPLHFPPKFTLQIVIATKNCCFYSGIFFVFVFFFFHVYSAVCVSRVSPIQLWTGPGIVRVCLSCPCTAWFQINVPT